MRIYEIGYFMVLVILIMLGLHIANGSFSCGRDAKDMGVVVRYMCHTGG